MKRLETEAPNFEKDDSPAQLLRDIERWERSAGRMKQPFDDWHFKLLASLTPHEVKFYTNAKYDGETIWFNSRTANGLFSFDFVKQHHRDNLFRALGKVRVCLAGGKKIIKDFYVSKPTGEYLTKDEIQFMLRLSARAIKGEKVDSYAELENFRMNAKKTG